MSSLTMYLMVPISIGVELCPSHSKVSHACNVGDNNYKYIMDNLDLALYSALLLLAITCSHCQSSYVMITTFCF